MIDELGLIERGLRWTPDTSGMFVPFDDGGSIQLWNDDARCDAEVSRVSPGDLDGWRALCDVKYRLREALRPADGPDAWVGKAPTRDQLEARIGDDPEAKKLLFEWSMVEYVERYLDDERLQVALLGQGVIGTNASPHDPGTASIHFHHASGRLGGLAGTWGFVEGGIGMVSFLLCDAARDAGAVVAAGLPVARIIPGRGSSWREATGSTPAPSSPMPTRGRPSDSSATPPTPPGRRALSRCRWPAAP